MNLSAISKDKIIGIIDKVAFFFFVVLVFFLPISNAIIESVFGFLLFCFILKIIIKRPSLEKIKSFLKNKINLAVLIFYICIGLSVLASGPLFAKSLGAWFFKWGEGVLLFYFAQVFLKKKQIKILLFVFVISSLLICIDGIYQRITGVGFIRGFQLMKDKAKDFFAIRATFDHYNDLASYLVVVFFIACGLMIEAKKNILKASLALLSLLILVILFLTYSRGAWIAFLVVTIFLGLSLKGRNLRIPFFVFLIIFIIVVASVPILRERFFHLVGKGADEGRFGLWQGAILMFKDSPLVGKGVGLFMDYIPQYSSIVGQYAHNCYLQILAETGLLGIISFLWVLGIVILKGLKKMFQSFEGSFVGIFAGLLAFSIHSFFDTQLFTLKLSILFWLILALATNYIVRENEL